MEHFERRKEVRYPVDIVVNLSCDIPAKVEIAARMVDKSSHGFRAVHNHLGLNSGEQVRFSSSESSGTARVMWTRIVGKTVESGFLIESTSK